MNKKKLIEKLVGLSGFDFSLEGFLVGRIYRHALEDSIYSLLYHWKLKESKDGICLVMYSGGNNYDPEVFVLHCEETGTFWEITVESSSHDANPFTFCEALAAVVQVTPTKVKVVEYLEHLEE